MREWHYVVDDQQRGPVPEGELIAMLGRGQLRPETLVWMPNMEEWAPANRLRGLVPPVGAPPSSPQFASMPAPTASQYTAAVPSAPSGGLFLHVPISRIIIVSIVSGGLYDRYWIYRNWRYLKERDGLDIWPFWRAVFGIFHCHSLFNALHEDQELVHVETPRFSPNGLATGWVLLSMIAVLISWFGGSAASAAAYFIPAFMCFVPVQNYINSVNAERYPGAAYANWSAGQALCVIFGLMGWTGTFLAILIGI